MSRSRVAVTFLILIVALGACAQADPTTSPLSPLSTLPAPTTQTTPTVAAVVATTPGTLQPGLASVQGQIVSASTSKPIPNVAVRLAEVYRSGDQGAFVLDDANSPAALTDANGFFVIGNVEPTEYVIVVGDVNIAYEIIAKSSGEARVWDLPPDEVTDVGTLQVTLQ